MQIVANIKTSDKVLLEQEFEADSIVEFVARQKFGDFFWEARKDVATEYALRAVGDRKDFDGFTFRSVDAIKEVEILITV